MQISPRLLHQLLVATLNVLLNFIRVRIGGVTNFVTFASPGTHIDRAASL